MVPTPLSCATFSTASQLNGKLFSQRCFEVGMGIKDHGFRTLVPYATAAMNWDELDQVQACAGRPGWVRRWHLRVCVASTGSYPFDAGEPGAPIGEMASVVVPVGLSVGISGAGFRGTTYDFSTAGFPCVHSAAELGDVVIPKVQQSSGCDG